MPEIVVDASVAAKWLLPEIGEDAARRVLDTYTPIAPDWMVVEVAHALDKRRRSGEVTTADMVDAISFVRLLVSMVPAEPLVTQAIHLARQNDLTVYDALYVALAEERRVGLVTADRKLARAPHATLLGS